MHLRLFKIKHDKPERIGSELQFASNEIEDRILLGVVTVLQLATDQLI